MIYRRLTSEEIVQLEKQSCLCSNWDDVFVNEKFEPNNISNSNFSGKIKLGVFTKEITLYGGFSLKAGIYNSTLHNCEIGNDCLIKDVKNYISNYRVADNVIINNVQMIANEGVSSFGNGAKVAVLDESGGREVLMYDSLSAQIAYIMTLYRYRPALIKNLEKIIHVYAEEKSSDMGDIGEGSVIYNSGMIKNVRIGECVTIEGIHLLLNGTVKSRYESPVYIGHNVTAENFIILSGSTVKNGVILTNCFVGQGCELGKNYSAENSLFFANCQGFHGEACSIFAGPFTVTHHKSTLLIAGMFSFLNAGSGSNQSNHMYKLGPIHQGIVERGSKTTSDSYLLWPAKIGAFTMVMGRHFKNSDTSDMPFSYLIESHDKSWLVPAINLRSVGTIRDAMKWPRRDKRSANSKIDCINFNLLSPYTIQKMLNGIKILEKLKVVSGESCEEYIYNNTSISNSSIRRGIEMYNIGIDKFLGNSVITRLHNVEFHNIEDLRRRLNPSSEVGKGEWIDMAGLIAPKNEINSILNRVESGEITSLAEIQAFLTELHDSYYDIEWNWTAGLLEKRLGKAIEKITTKDIIKTIQRWKKSVVELDQMLYNDAKKEFQLSSMTGFGTDGDSKTKLRDFEEVRGNFDTNALVVEIKNHIKRKSALGERMIKELLDCSDCF